jgi:hypothetical protein
MRVKENAASRGHDIGSHTREGKFDLQSDCQHFLIARELHEDQTPQSEEYLDGQLSIYI